MMLLHNIKTGEQVYAKSRKGYDAKHGWRVKKKSARRPLEGEDVKRRAELRAMDQADLAEMLLGKIAKLEKRVKGLEDARAATSERG